MQRVSISNKLYQSLGNVEKIEIERERERDRLVCEEEQKRKLKTQTQTQTQPGLRRAQRNYREHTVDHIISLQ